eukprot:2377878-Amphidinium_carterae.1
MTDSAAVCYWDVRSWRLSKAGVHGVTVCRMILHHRAPQDTNAINTLEHVLEKLVPHFKLPSVARKRSLKWLDGEAFESCLLSHFFVRFCAPSGLRLSTFGTQKCGTHREMKARRR